MAVSQCKPLFGEDTHAEREDAENRRHDNTIAMMGPPKKQEGGGAQNIFPLWHTQVDYDSKRALNLQWNRSNNCSKVARTNPLID